MCRERGLSLAVEEAEERQRVMPDGKGTGIGMGMGMGMEWRADISRDYKRVAIS